MVGKKVLTRENTPTDELQRSVTKVINGVEVTYNEVYYLDFEVEEDTGIIDKNMLVEHYTKDQINRNLKAQKSAYLIAKGAIAPTGWMQSQGSSHPPKNRTVGLILIDTPNRLSEYVLNDVLAASRSFDPTERVQGKQW